MTRARSGSVPLAGGESGRGAGGPIVVVGAHLQSLLLRVEAIPREGETALAYDYDEPMDGGKATNQAVAAARLGAPVRFLSIVGNDARGDAIRGYLEEQGIDTTWLHVEPGATDVGFVMLPPSGIPAITSCQDLSRRLDGDLVRRSATAFQAASVVVCQLEAPVACAMAAFAIARRVGAITVLNPAPAVPLPDELFELCDVLVPNEHEARALLDADASSGELATRLAARLPVTDVIVTAGAAGAFLALADGRRAHAVAPSVVAVDTTGAGDAFVGALATRLRLGADVVDAVRFAVVAASLSVTRAGTMPAYPSLDEVASTTQVPAAPTASSERLA